MDNSNVISILNQLVQEIDFVIDSINQQGARKFFTSDYTQTKAMLDRVQKVIMLKEKVNDLLADWKNLDLNVPKRTSSDELPNTGKKKNSKRVKQGHTTKQRDFEIPILIALDSIGGTGSRPEVINIIEKLLIDELTEEDWQTRPSNPNVIVWKNNVAWARSHLVRQGFLSDKSPQGIWEITSAGHQVLAESKKKR
jgi:hypothetical protein